MEAYREMSALIQPLISANASVIYEPLDLLGDALSAAIDYGITIYDALFVAATLRTRGKLVSFDKKLKQKLMTRNPDIVYPMS